MSDLVDCSRPCTASVVGRGVRRQSLRCSASLAPTMARVDALLEHAKTATALDPFRCRHGAGCGLEGACRRLNGACCGPAHDSVFRSFPPSSRARDGGADGACRTRLFRHLGHSTHCHSGPSLAGSRDSPCALSWVASSSRVARPGPRSHVKMGSAAIHYLSQPDQRHVYCSLCLCLSPSLSLPSSHHPRQARVIAPSFIPALAPSSS
jgi:hypothetical protein